MQSSLLSLPLPHKNHTIALIAAMNLKLSEKKIHFEVHLTVHVCIRLKKSFVTFHELNLRKPSLKVIHLFLGRRSAKKEKESQLMRKI